MPITPYQHAIAEARGTLAKALVAQGLTPRMVALLMGHHWDIAALLQQYQDRLRTAYAAQMEAQFTPVTLDLDTQIR